MAFAMVVAGSKMTSADVFTQKVLEQREEADLARVASFAAFGIIQIGIVHFTIASRILPVIFPYTSVFAAKSLGEKVRDARGLLSICRMTTFHEGLVTPFQIFPAFYVFKELCQGTGAGGPAGCVRRALSTYGQNFWEDNLQSLKIFLPANFINFLLMPVHLRVPFATVSGIVWAVVLSLSRGSTAQAGAKDAVAAPAAGAKQAQQHARAGQRRRSPPPPPAACDLNAADVTLLLS